jgi:hypothetical protein
VKNNSGGIDDSAQRTLQSLSHPPRHCVFESRKSEIDTVRVQPPGSDLLPQGCEHGTGSVCDRDLSFFCSECDKLWVALELVYRREFAVQPRTRIDFHRH